MPTSAPRTDAKARLDVRLHGGRPVTYVVEEEFLIGTAAGCDLRLADHTLPPIVGRLVQQPNGLTLHTFANNAIVLNNAPLADQQTVTMRASDRLVIGSVEVLVQAEHADYLHPQLLPIAQEHAATPRHDIPPSTGLDQKDLERWREELERRQAAIDEQARELEEDRKIWYRRRQEMEAELERQRQSDAERGQSRSATDSLREEQLRTYEAELAKARAKLEQDYQERKRELTSLADQVHQGQTALEASRAALESEFARLRSELEASLTNRREQLEREWAERRRILEEEAAQRRAESVRLIETSPARLLETRLEREQADAARAALADERQRLETQRQALAGESAALAAEQARHAEQAAQRQAELDRQETDIKRREAALAEAQQQLDAERLAHKDDLLRLSRWQASLEDKQALLDARAAEIAEQSEQLRRDVAELEDQMRAAVRTEDRLTEEQQRLDRRRQELESLASQLAERSAQIEHQQASMAMLRVRLDQQHHDIRTERQALERERLGLEAARENLEARLRDACALQADRDGSGEQTDWNQRSIQEQLAILTASLDQFERDKQAFTEAEARLRQREADVESREAALSEQAAELKAKLMQALELQQRLEADRLALRERERALSEADAARQAVQEQLRQRAEELAARAQHLDADARSTAEERAMVERQKATIDEWRTRAEVEVAAQRHDLETRIAELEQHALAVRERERSLERQVDRLRQAGAALAAERKALFATRQAWEDEQAARRREELELRQTTEKLQLQAAGLLDELRTQVPELEARADLALQKLATARDGLRGHFTQLQAFADETRQVLAAERDMLHARERALHQAQHEQHQAFTKFRQEIMDWQAKIAALRRELDQRSTHSEHRERDLTQASERLKLLQQELDRRTAELHEEQRLALARRNEMERHLADMREWYRHKLRELAAGRRIDDRDMPVLPFDSAKAPPVRQAAAVPRDTVVPRDTAVPRDTTAPRNGAAPQDTADARDEDPANQQLAALLAERKLLERPTLDALLDEARRQGKTLRQLLLAHGVVTVFQLAMIESGQIEALAQGRFRLIDRLWHTNRESVYRVYDPTRPAAAVWLRFPADSVCNHPTLREEYLRGFSRAVQAQHAHRVNILEIAELNGRPAVLQEAVLGLKSTDWPPLAAVPGVWLRLLTQAARGIADAHRCGLLHGRLSLEHFVLGLDGLLRTSGWGEPAWLAHAAESEPTTAGDLRALGRAAFRWSQIGAKRRDAKFHEGKLHDPKIHETKLHEAKHRGVKTSEANTNVTDLREAKTSETKSRNAKISKGLPSALAAVVRRLEACGDSPMGDVVSIDQPYANAMELVADLERLAGDHPCPVDAWNQLVASIGAAREAEGRGAEEGLRQSA